MQIVTTKATAKVAAVATGIAMATSMLSFAPMVHAAALTDAQVQSILSLLSSFGANAATIANVNAALTGAPVTTPPSTTSACSFSRNLTIGSSGADVTCLQSALIGAGFSISAGATGYFGTQTRTAVASWQSSKNIAPAVGYFGSISRAAFNLGGGVVVVPPGTTPPPTGNGLKVTLASDSPNGTVLVQAQAIGELAKFTFANPTSADIKVTNLGFNRIGSSADSTLSAVYLYAGAVRLTDAASISSGAFNFNDSTGIFTVPAGQTYTVTVRSNIAGSTNGQQVGVKLVSVSSNGTLDSSVSFPIMGGLQTISSATIGTVALTYTGPTGATENPGTDVRVFEGSTVISNHAVDLQSISFENRGTSKDGDLKNFRLYVDGTLVGSTVSQASADKITFDLTSNPLRLATGTRVIKVLADIVGGSSYTYDIQVRRAVDARFVDVELGQPVLMTGTFAAATANTIASGTLSITKANTSPSENVSVSSTNVKWATFEVRAAGEDVKVETLKVWVDQGGADGMDNAKIFLNGVQIGSTKDLASDTDPDNDGTTFDLGSSFVARHGVVEILEIYGDAKDDDATNYASGTSVDIGVSVAATDTEGMSSGNTVTAISEVEGNSRSMSSSTLTASKYSAYANQTMIAGTNNAKLGSFVLSAGSTEGVNINTIAINLSAVEAATITDLRLVDAATGVQIGSTKVSPSGSAGAAGDNSFSVNIAIPVNGTKTIDLVGNIKSSANAGPWQASLDATTGGTGAVTAQTVNPSADVDLQTITVGSATLTAAVGVSPDNTIVVAGATMVKVGSFDFTSQYSAFTVDKIAVKVTNNAASSVASVTLRYPNASGVSTDSSASLTSPSTIEPFATATFTGLSFYIPQNTTKKLDVYVNLASIQTDTDSGKAITVTLGDDGGYRNTDSSGAANTNLASGDLASTATGGKGTMYVRKSVPTLSPVALDTQVFNDGTNRALGRVKVTADAAGDVSWAKMAFTINKSAAATIGATSTVKLWQGSNIIAGFFATTTAGDTKGVALQSFPAVADGGTSNLNLSFIADAEQKIDAGTSATYELRGTLGGNASGVSIDVSIANPSTTASTTATAAQVGANQATLGGTSGTPSLVWSDRSIVSSVHSLTTADWTNDYLVKSLPLTIGNLVSQIP